MQPNFIKIKKYLDNNNIYSSFQSEIIREEYKRLRIVKESPESKLIDNIYKMKFYQKEELKRSNIGFNI